MPDCKKKKYMTRATAYMVLDKIHDSAIKTGRRRDEKRVYKCGICSFWHLTKKDRA